LIKQLKVIIWWSKWKKQTINKATQLKAIIFLVDEAEEANDSIKRLIESNNNFGGRSARSKQFERLVEEAGISARYGQGCGLVRV
jgi:hypothetical protein